jgi:arginyl-tRNA synthetase
MAKKASKKTKKAAKKSAKRKKLAVKKSARKQARELSKKVGAQATKTPNASKGSARSSKKSKGVDKKLRKSPPTPASSAKTRVVPQVEVRAKKEAPKKEAPKKEAPKKEAPKKEAPKKEAPKKEAPKKEAPKKEAPLGETILEIKTGKKPKKLGKLPKSHPKENDPRAGERPSLVPESPPQFASRPHLFADVLARVHAVCSALASEGGWPAGIDLSRVVVEPPRDAAHGDMATNAAMVLAKEAKIKPRDLAEQIAAKLRADDLIASVDVADPGFINLTLKVSAWLDALRGVLREGDAYGRSAMGGDEKVNVEYVSANPTGPMHVGHGRGAVFGDALVSLLKFAGYDVTREYYINDAGAQVDVLARSAYLRYREALGENIGTIPEGLYPGDYLKPVGQALAAEYGDKLLTMTEGAWLPTVRSKAITMMMEEIKGDLAALNIRHDVFFSERSLIETGNNKVTETIDYLRSKGDVYEGRLPPPKGKPVEDYEDREQMLFRATAFGDDIDRPLVKSDGSYTYFASDIAYHKNKFDRGFAEMIDVLGADHGGYVKRMKAAVRAITEGKGHLNVKLVERLDIKLIQLVRLLRNGEPVKMSKRSGEFVTLREVVDEVGKDAVRFMMLYRKNDAVLDFDLAKVIEQSRENPVFYVQYGHARGHSVFRNAREVVPDLPEDTSARAAFLGEAAVERLTDPAELDLLRRLALYPRIIEAAAAAHEPHRIAFYLYDLASEFHALWTRGRDLPYLRFIINNDAEITKARLALVQGVVSVLASGLAILGVHAPDEMR